jgi:hypothetical protein
MLAYIAAHTQPNERVFFGTFTHEWVRANEIDLYFLADRLPGVRYTEYDPNVVTRREVQEEMIAWLESYQVRVAVLSSLIKSHDVVPGLLPGSRLLDDYLSAHFDRVEQHEVYSILVRKQ